MFNGARVELKDDGATISATGAAGAVHLTSNRDKWSEMINEVTISTTNEDYDELSPVSTT